MDHEHGHGERRQSGRQFRAFGIAIRIVPEIIIDDIVRHEIRDQELLREFIGARGLRSSV